MPSRISLGLNSFFYRILLPVAALLLLAALIFVLRWCVADAASIRADDKAIIELAAAWAPDDPQTHYALASLYEKSFLPEDIAKAVPEYEKAAALSPSDYRFLLPLARAREQSGDSEGAEKALRYALRLAPNYAQIHWALGNVLLRQGRSDEAFAEMRLAVDANPVFAAPAASTALQFSDEDYPVILQKLGNSSEIKAAMALTLARQKRFDEGLAVWGSVPEDERRSSFKEKSTELFNILLAEKKFRYALKVKAQPGQDNSGQPAVGVFSNSGFETPVDISDTSPFSWQIAPGAQPLIGVDDKQKHGGNFSLGMVFAKSSGKDFRQISQTVTVESNTSYRFKVFMRSEIQTTGALRWEIADANSGEVLAATKDISAENTGWEELAADFKTGAQTEGVIIRLVRPGCQNCSIEGRIWFDDFSLEKR